jgi:hypothetical protein
MPIAATAADSAGDIAASDSWQFKVQAYGWFPVIKGTLPTDDDIEITFDEILDSLDFTFMGGIQASRGKWAIVSDVVYLKLSPDEAGKTTIPIGPSGIPAFRPESTSGLIWKSGSLILPAPTVSTGRTSTMCRSWLERDIFRWTYG